MSNSFEAQNKFEISSEVKIAHNKKQIESVFDVFKKINNNDENYSGPNGIEQLRKEIALMNENTGWGDLDSLYQDLYKAVEEWRNFESKGGDRKKSLSFSEKAATSLENLYRVLQRK